MKRLKSERHHWWPECVSKHWADTDGKVGWIRPDGNSKRIVPKELGVIRDGHHMRFGSTTGKPSPWDKSYEGEFEKADNWFPGIIEWLNGLKRVDLYRLSLSARFLPAVATDEQLTKLTECIVSLAVRSPRYRWQAVSLAEQLRGPLSQLERDGLIGTNIHNSQRVLSDAVNCRAKFGVLYSEKSEFLFGDGFFSYLSGGIQPIHHVRILAPVAPNISVAILKTSGLGVEPKLSTLVLNDDEVCQCNLAVQVYSRDALFYRNQRPELDISFTSGKFCNYSSDMNPIDMVLRSMPGVTVRRRTAF